MPVPSQDVLCVPCDEGARQLLPVYGRRGGGVNTADVKRQGNRIYIIVIYPKAKSPSKSKRQGTLISIIPFSCERPEPNDRLLHLSSAPKIMFGSPGDVGWF
jgi:hypothetical protein